jgi:hypothetical protein
MNTNVRIVTHSSNGKAGGKNNYIKGRDKGHGTDEIHVLIDNGFSGDRVRLTAEQKKERRQMQKNLSIYKKRMSQAQDKGKDHIAEKNRKKIEEIQAKLDQPFVKDHEKEIIDLTLTLVNGKQAKDLTPEHKEAYNKIVKEFVAKEFKDLHTVTLATHYDQRSPHAHILMQCTGLAWSSYLRDRYGVEDTRDAYSQIQHDFHDFVESRIKGKLDELKQGQQYVGLGEFKKHGNYEVRGKEPLESADIAPSKVSPPHHLEEMDQVMPLAAPDQQVNEEKIYSTIEELIADNQHLDYWELNKLADKWLKMEENKLETEKEGNDSSEEEKTLKIDSQQDFQADEPTQPTANKRSNRKKP